MIAVFLDRDYKEVVSINERSIIEATRGRFIEGRIVKNSLTLVVDLNVYNEVKKASYIVVSSDSRLRNQPVYRIVDTEIGRNYKIEASGAGIEELKYKRVKEIDTKLYDKDSKKVAGIISALVGNGWRYIFGEGIRRKTTLETIGGGSVYEALEELADDIDVDIEFEYRFGRGETVTTKVVNFQKEFGEDITSGIVYGVNATSFKMKEYRDDVKTSVVAYGKEDEDGVVLDLSSLSGRSYKLNTGRNAIVKRTPGGEYGLEVPELTREFGIYNIETKKVEPKIAEVNVAGIEDVNVLISEAMRELENSLPEIEITINGSNIQADVGDKLPVYHEQLNIDVNLDIISIDENMLVEDDIRYQIGVRKKSEYDKKFDNIVVAPPKEDKEDNSGIVRRQVIYPKTVTYQGYNSFAAEPNHWISKPDFEIYPEIHDYYLTFNYNINSDYTASEFILGMTFYDTAVWNRESSRNKGFPNGLNIDRMASQSISGNKGTVKIKLNDYADFMAFRTKRFVSKRVYNAGEIVGIRDRNWIVPYIIVTDSIGDRLALNYIDYPKDRPTTTAERAQMAGYIDNFQITEHER